MCLPYIIINADSGIGEDLPYIHGILFQEEKVFIKE